MAHHASAVGAMRSCGYTAILILIFDDPELPTVSYGCYDVSLFPQAEEAV
jgi:hypothetical protein